jgi:hypothetical protein
MSAADVFGCIVEGEGENENRPSPEEIDGFHYE